MTSPRDPEGAARLVAGGAGCFWLLLSVALVGMSLLAAAVSVRAFVIFGPWAIAALVLAAALLFRRPSRRTLVASSVLGFLSLAFSILTLLGSSEDFSAGIMVFAAMSAGAVAYSVLALRRLPSVISNARR